MSIDQAIALPHPARDFACTNDRLPKGSVYRSVAARREYFEAYDEIVARLNMPVRAMSVPTRYGSTHISVAGDPASKPLLLLPGMSICGPLMLEFFEFLVADRMVIAPDLVGQPGLSADGVFKPGGNAYGKWLTDVLDGLGIKKIDIVGPSFGGSIGLDFAALHPERVGKMALIVTAGLTPSIPYARVYAPLFITWLLYRYLPYKPILGTIAKPMCRVWEPQNLDYLDLVIRTTNYWRHRPAGVFSQGQFKDSIEPVFISFSRRDHLLPYRRTRERAHKVLPIAREMIMDNSAHMPNLDDVRPVHREIQRFLAG